MQQNYFRNDAFNLQKEIPFPQFNVASKKHPGIRLSFEYTTTLLSGEGGVERNSTATVFGKVLPKYTIFSTVLSKIVATFVALQVWYGIPNERVPKSPLK